MAQMIHNHQGNIGSKRKFCADVDNKPTKTKCKFTFTYKANIKYAKSMRNKTNFPLFILFLTIVFM